MSGIDHWEEASRRFDKAHERVLAKQARNARRLRRLGMEPVPYGPTRAVTTHGEMMEKLKIPPPPPGWTANTDGSMRYRPRIQDHKFKAALSLGMQGLMGYGIYKLIDKIKSKKDKKDNTNGSGEQRRPTRRRAFKKGGVVKRKVVRKRAHKKAGKR